MKRPYALLSTTLVLLPFLVNAQTITTSEAPNVGDSFVDNYYMYMAPGSGGSGQTWDFSALASDSTRSIAFQTPASTGVSGSFPNATIAETSGMGDYSFFEESSSGFDLQGVYISSLPQETVYQDPERVLAFPCMLNTTWTDDFSSTFTVSGFTIMRAGTITGLADGSGTLIMPYGTVNNVLRVRTFEDYTDASIVDVDYEFTTYFYYKPGNRHPLMMIFHQEVTTFGTTSISESLVWTDQGQASIAELTGEGIGFEIYPNPATEQATLHYGGAGESLSVEVLDLAGRIVHCEKLPAQALGMYRHGIDVRQFSKGVYQVRLTTKSGRQGVNRLYVQ